MLNTVPLDLVESIVLWERSVWHVGKHAWCVRAQPVRLVGDVECSITGVLGVRAPESRPTIHEAVAATTGPVQRSGVGRRA